MKTKQDLVQGGQGDRDTAKATNAANIEIENIMGNE